jgi:ribosomal protein L12E/L44/L45/RPP1/RPP2
MSDQARRDVNNAIIRSDAADIALIVDAGNSSKARREEAKQKREEEERKRKEEEEKAKASGS